MSIWKLHGDVIKDIYDFDRLREFTAHLGHAELSNIHTVIVFGIDIAVIGGVYGKRKKFVMDKLIF